jgi:uncharacterized protein (TIGR03067 family)
VKTIAVLCVVAVGSVAWGADTKAPTKGVLDGIWTLSSGTMAGEKMDEEMSKNIKLTLAGGKYTVNIGEQKDEGTYKTDDSKTPHTLTIVSTEGPNKGKTILAIYELSKGSLKVCYDMSGKAFPKKFESEANTQSFLGTYERQKSTKHPFKLNTGAAK